MFLLNSCLGLFTAAPSLGRPFSRSYGAILPSSLAVLLPPASGSSPCPPVSVCGTGAWRAIAAFLGTRSVRFATQFRSASRHRACALLRLRRAFRPRLAPRACVPARSVAMQYRNLHLSSIGYASLPRLRPRLTQGRSASPWKPRAFGREDSHLSLATHSGILSPRRSTAPHGAASARRRCSPTGMPDGMPPGFGGVFQHRTFSARGLSASELLRTLSMRGCF